MKHRVTITLDDEVYAAYRRMTFRSGGTSFSKFVNDWLSTTADAAENMVHQIHLAHIQPELALNELILFQEQMREESLAVSQRIEELQAQAAGSTARSGAPDSAHPQASPAATATPLTNRGGKLRNWTIGGGDK